MISRELLKKVEKRIDNVSNIRNIGTAAHIDHGKTTLRDNLVAGAGIISEERAGDQLFLDSDVQEKARGITINAASVTMLFEKEKQPYIINLIDTPGHVDFGGDVTRAMRALDGVLILICAIEGLMPQSETVIKQALKEKVRPILFINKVDRLINELLLDAAEIRKRLTKYIEQVNTFIERHDGLQHWKVNLNEGTVLLGSAYHKWALSIPHYKATGFGFQEIINYCRKGQSKELSKIIPLHKIVLDRVIMHVPSPIDARKYRIPNMSKEPQTSKVGQALLSRDPNGPASFFIIKVLAPPKKESYRVGRIFSGTLTKGMVLIEPSTGKKHNIRKIALTIGVEQARVSKAKAGMLVGITGTSANTGETLAEELMCPFEEFAHYSEPVMTYSVGIKDIKDLAKLIDALGEIKRRDPSLETDINEETGEFLLSGMGELHLEITLFRLKNEYNLDIIIKQPKVLYKERPNRIGQEFEGKSPNKHNRLLLRTEVMSDETFEFLKEYRTEGNMKKVEVDMIVKQGKLERDKARRILYQYNGNLFIDQTRSAQRMAEVMESMIMAFKRLCNKGPLRNEKIQKLIVYLTDIDIHVDGVHRGPAQIIPALLSGAYKSLRTGGIKLFEPYQKITLTTPSSLNSQIISWVQQKRGEVLEIERAGGQDIEIKFLAPVAELFGFSSEIRGLTNGRASWDYANAAYYAVPRYLEQDVIAQIRKDKNLKSLKEEEL
jgi:elongation factor 2